MKYRSEDLTGRTFTRLKVIRRAGTAPSGAALFECECDCGAIVIKRASHLRQGAVKSCGCLHDTHGIGKQYGKTHGMTYSRTYTSWAAMKERCSNPNHPHYAEYGGRGIVFDKKWTEFVGFLEDMGERPVGTTLDRKDGNKGYFKSNCRWATPKEQGRNKRTNRLVELDGRVLTVSAWSEITGIGKTTIKARLNRGLSAREALCQ